MIVWVLSAGSLLADIDCKDSYEANEPIVVKVAVTGVPDGARMRGSITVSGEAGIWQPDATKGEYGVWASSGEHVITATGIWVQTRDVKIGEETVPVLVDFGQYSYSKAFKVGDGGPDPPNPPNPSGQYRIALFYSEQQLDNLPQPQRDILTSLVFRKWLETAGHVLVVVDDPVNYAGGSSAMKPWIDAALNKPLPLVAIAPKTESGYITTYDLPANTDAMKALLGSSAVKKAVKTK